MLDEYYVILATDKDDNTIYYASNTGPLLWTTEFSMIKPFNSLDSAKVDLDDEEFIVKYLLKYNYVNAIYISRFIGTKEVERIEYNVN